jgi:hypothetical protein
MSYTQAHIDRAMQRQSESARALGGRSRIIDESSGAHLAMSVDPDLFHNAGLQNGYGCWKDPEWTSDMARKFPEIALTPTSGKIRVGSPGGGVISAARNRFGKIKCRIRYTPSGQRTEQVFA